jgi:hypothetical protein
LRLGLVSVDVGVAKLEAELLVEPVGRDPGGPGGQVDAPSPSRLRLVDCRHGQRGANALAAGVLVDNDIFDPCPQPGGSGKVTRISMPTMTSWLRATNTVVAW